MKPLRHLHLIDGLLLIVNRAGARAMAIEAAFYPYASIANIKIPCAGLLVDNRYRASHYVDKIAPPCC